MAHPPPGRLVELPTHRLHIRCEGSGSPSVVFDAALGASSLSWALVYPLVARTTRACTYDRAGFGWSDAGPLPRTAGRLADELDLLLTRSAVPPPYVLVGHSFGGLVMQILASRHRSNVAGLVLIEPAHPEDWMDLTDEQRRLVDRGVRLCRHGATAARLGLARVVSLLARSGALGAARALVSIVSRGGLRRDDEGLLAPVRKLPPEVRAIVGDAWTRPGFFVCLGSQIASIAESAAEAARETSGGYDSLPLVVITAEGSSERRLRADAALAQRSTRGRHVIVSDSGHWVPIDAPDAVARAIVELVEEVRSAKAGPTINT